MQFHVYSIKNYKANSIYENWYGPYPDLEDSISGPESSFFHFFFFGPIWVNPLIKEVFLSPFWGQKRRKNGSFWARLYAKNARF